MEKYTYRDFLYDICKYTWSEFKILWGFTNWLQGILTIIVWLGGIGLLVIFQYIDYAVESIITQLVMILSGLIISVVCLFFLGAFVSPFKIYKELKDKEIYNEYYSKNIRITKTPDNKGLTLYNLSDSIFSGNIYLLAVIELDDFPALTLQTIDGDSILKLSPKIPIQINLVDVEENNVTCVDNKGRIVNYREGNNTLIIRLSGEFKGYSKTITKDTYWILNVNKKKRVVRLRCTAN